MCLAAVFCVFGVFALLVSARIIYTTYQKAGEGWEAYVADNSSAATHASDVHTVHTRPLCFFFSF